MSTQSASQRENAPNLGGSRTRSRPSDALGGGLTLVPRHVWTKTAVSLKTSFRLYGQTREVTVTIDLSAFKLSEGSLLKQVLLNIPCPATYTYANLLRNVLGELTPLTEVREVLEAPPSALGSGDINLLFIRMEDVVDGFGGKTKYMRSSQARAYFNQFPAKLKDGRTVAESGFKSRFSEGRRKPRESVAGTLRSTDKKGKPTKMLDDFDTLEERNDRFLQQAQSRQGEIFALCQKSFEDHRAVVARIQEAKLSGLPALRTKVRMVLERGGWLTNDVFRGHTEDEQLRIALHVFQRENFDRQAPERYLPLTGMTFLYPYTIKPTQQLLFELLLSDFYLPRHVILACIVAIVTDTGLNAETVLSMIERHVRRTPSGFELVGLKGRTGQLQGAAVEDGSQQSGNSDREDHDRITSATAVQAIELLLEHARAVEKCTGQKSAPLTLSMNQHYSGPHEFGPFNLYRAQQDFWAYHESEVVDWPELRRLAAHVDFLSPGGSIYTVNAKLGHASLETTTIYLNSGLIHLLLEANVRRFMRHVAATAIFQRGGEVELTKRKLSKKDVRPQLLFPISPSDTRPPAVDAWIASGGTLPLSIGSVEIQHCALAYHYYQNNFERLIDANSLRFLMVHFPRMVFCMALRKVILASAHAGLYKRLEGKLK